MDINCPTYKISLHRAFIFLSIVATGMLLRMLMFSHSHVLPYRDSNDQKEIRILTKSDVILISLSQQQTTEISPSNNCLQFQHYITELIKSHHPDSAKLLCDKNLFKSTRAHGNTNTTDCYSDFSLKFFHPGLYARSKMVFSNHTCYNNHTVVIDYRDLLIYSPDYNEFKSKGDVYSLHTGLHSKDFNLLTNNMDHININSTGNIKMSEGYSDNTHSKSSARSDFIKFNITDLDLVLLTSMYHSTVKQFLFINTIINWSNLTVPSRVQPVLFLTHMDIVEKSGILLYVAYLKGWIIAVAPDCLRSRYPLLHSMFHLGRDVVPNATWYGYANGDILFTPSFMKTISQINQYNTQVNDTAKPIVFISSKRTDVYVPRGELYTNPNDIITLSHGTKTRSGIAIDLLVYHQNCTEVLKKMPRFAVGRRGFDNWLIYDILHRRLGSVDITGTSPMVHLGINGLHIRDNSHRTRKQDRDYNMHIINATAVKFPNWYMNVDNVRTVSQLERTGGSSSKTDGDLYRQWVGEVANIKFRLKSRNGKITYI